MNRFFLLFFFQLLLAGIVVAQSAVDTTTISGNDSIRILDTVVQQDTLVITPAIDSFSVRPRTDSGWKVKPGTLYSSHGFSWQVMQHHPYFNFSSISRVLPHADLKKFVGKEWLFYLLVFLLLVFAILRSAFFKYFNDLFRLFFRTTLKQRQIREQLMQTPLPSLLLNGFFVISGGLYITFLLQHFKLDPVNNFWQLFLYCCFGLSAAYFVKFIGLKASGWLFNMSDAADSYIFIVFVINKMIGILILPFLVIIAFGVGNLYSVGLTLSWCLVLGLFFYRFILTYSVIRNQVKVNPFHFFLYLLAFEVAPLLLVYKGLLLFFGITA